MAHLTNKEKEKRRKENRGDTFAGFYPRIEDSKIEKLRKKEKKHKNKMIIVNDLQT